MRSLSIIFCIVLPLLLGHFSAYANPLIDNKADKEKVMTEEHIETISPLPPEKVQNMQKIVQKSKVFGANLFTGKYAQASFSGFNPNYMISVGDNIVIRMWGAFNHEAKYNVDAQGNIFLPHIGPVKVLGITSGNLNGTIEVAAKKVFENNVFIYANLNTAQPVKVFVSGAVCNPGLYSGLSSDSVLSYLDKAGGIDLDRGSFIDVTVLRNNSLHAKFNLYEFLAEGHVKLIQLVDGDVIFIGPRKNMVTVSGTVANEAEFEFEGKTTAHSIIKLAQPKASSTNFTLSRAIGIARTAFHYRLSEAAQVILENGDQIMVTDEKGAESILVKVERPHAENKSFAVAYGSTLADLLDQVFPTPGAQMDAIQIFRKSVAIRQKEAIHNNLSKLESIAYTTASATGEAANIHAKEADLITKFIERAKQVEPKGQIVLGADYNPKEIVLEEGDVIFIPEKTSLVLVQGEVNFPTALVYKRRSRAKDYIQRVGGYSSLADKNNVLIIRRSGVILNSKSSGSYIEPGDEILVLPRVDTKNLEVAKTLTQILFQIAVSTKVVLGL